MNQFISILFFFTLTLGFSQEVEQVRNMDSLQYSTKVDSLKNMHATNKYLTKDCELVSLIALSYYPALQDARIEFRKAKIKTTLNVRPTVFSLLFRSKKKRLYRVRINKLVRDSVISFHSIPFNAKVGLLGHEFAHIKDYSERGLFQIVGRLLSYSNKESKANYEKEIDSITVQQGLGWQLYDWSDYVLNQSNAKNDYKEFKRRTYLRPEEIEGMIR